MGRCAGRQGFVRYISGLVLGVAPGAVSGPLSVLFGVHLLGVLSAVVGLFFPQYPGSLCGKALSRAVRWHLPFF